MLAAVRCSGEEQPYLCLCFGDLLLSLHLCGGGSIHLLEEGVASKVWAGILLPRVQLFGGVLEVFFQILNAILKAHHMILEVDGLVCIAEDDGFLLLGC